MNIKSRIAFDQIIISVIFFSAIVLASWIVIYPDSQLVLLFGGALGAISIVLRPVLGLAAYILIYPMVPAEESISILKIVMFGLIALILTVWVIQKSLLKTRVFTKPEYRWLYAFFFFLCFSPLLGIENGFSILDWARDIAPLSNLLLVPIMIDYFEKKQNQWLLYLIFIPIGLGIVHDILVLLENYGISFEILSFVTTLPIPSIHPSFGLGLGLLMYLQKAPRRRLWLILSALSLMLAFLTPTRTVWITTVTMVLLIIAFGSHRRRWTVMCLVILVAVVGWLIFFQTGSDTYVASQRDRFQGLIELQHNLSFENRIEEIKQAKELFKSSPVYGVGFGYHYSFWRPFITGIGPGILSSNFTHNDIMYIASKGGIIGLILFGLMLYGFVIKLFERKKEKPDSLQSAWATFAILMLFNSLLIGLSTPVYQTRWATFALAALLALGLGYKGPETDAKQS